MVRGFALAFVLSFGPAVSNSFARFAYALVLPAMRSELSLNYSQAGWLNTANALGYLAGAVLTRLLVQQLGNRLLFSAGMFVTAIGVLATGLTADASLIAGWRALAGLGGAAVFICGGALSGNIFPDRPALGTTTIAVYFAGGGIGLVICGVMVPLLLEHGGNAAWPTAWLWMGIISVLMAFATVWAAYRIVEPGAAVGHVKTSIRPFFPELIGYLMFGLGYIGYMTFVVAWMRESGAPAAMVLPVWIALGLTTILAPAVWRIPLAQWSAGRPMALIMSVLALGALLPLLGSGYGVMVTSAALFGLAMFSVPSSISSLIKRSLPKPAWGSVMATFTVVFALGQTIGPVAAGWLADQFGSLRPGLTASVAALVFGALVALLQSDTTTDRRSQQAGEQTNRS